MQTLKFNILLFHTYISIIIIIVLCSTLEIDFNACFRVAATFVVFHSGKFFTWRQQLFFVCFFLKKVVFFTAKDLINILWRPKYLFTVRSIRNVWWLSYFISTRVRSERKGEAHTHISQQMYDLTHSWKDWSAHARPKIDFKLCLRRIGDQCDITLGYKSLILVSRLADSTHIHTTNSFRCDVLSIVNWTFSHVKIVELIAILPWFYRFCSRHDAIACCLMTNHVNKCSIKTNRINLPNTNAPAQCYRHSSLFEYIWCLPKWERNQLKPTIRN